MDKMNNTVRNGGKKVNSFSGRSLHSNYIFTPVRHKVLSKRAVRKCKNWPTDLNHLDAEKGFTTDAVSCETSVSSTAHLEIFYQVF